MVTNPNRPREAGRPRTFSDGDAYRATMAVLVRSGHQQLTLAAVAGELGCTRQALSRRFGSKGQLLRAYLAWVIEQVENRYRIVRSAYPSPLTALSARFLLLPAERPDEVADPIGEAHLLAFFIDAGTDPELRELAVRLVHVYEANVADLVAEACAAGELVPCDAPLVAQLLNTATTGALLYWAVDPQGSAMGRIATVFNAIIDHYRPSASR